MFPTYIKTDAALPQTQINPVGPITAILESQGSSADLEPGARYQAIIEARLQHGFARLLVGDKLLLMQLPEKYQPGKTLDLVFLSQDPKLKFLVLNETILNRQATTGSTTASTILSGTTLSTDTAATLKNAAAVQSLTGQSSGSPASPVTEENTTSISLTGRFLGTLIQDSLKQGGNTLAHALTSATPILSGPPLDSTELPALLQKAIVQSGLFYESHQAQWVHGKNTLENLQQEPQGKLLLVTTTVDSPVARASAAPAGLGSDMPINTQTIPLVQQQLNTLETGHLLWRGEVWQGQSMEWDVFEHPPEDKGQNPEAASQWRSQLRLSMPHLGDITATITLGAQGLNIRLNSSQEDTVNLLKNNQTPLATGMQTAGLNLQAIEIQHDDKG